MLIPFGGRELMNWGQQQNLNGQKQKMSEAETNNIPQCAWCIMDEDVLSLYFSHSFLCPLQWSRILVRVWELGIVPQCSTWQRRSTLFTYCAVKVQMNTVHIRTCTVWHTAVGVPYRRGRWEQDQVSIKTYSREHQQSSIRTTTFTCTQLTRHPLCPSS